MNRATSPARGSAEHLDHKSALDVFLLRVKNILDDSEYLFQPRYPKFGRKNHEADIAHFLTDGSHLGVAAVKYHAIAHLNVRGCGRSYVYINIFWHGLTGLMWSTENAAKETNYQVLK